MCGGARKAQMCGGARKVRVCRRILSDQGALKTPPKNAHVGGWVGVILEIFGVFFENCFGVFELPMQRNPKTQQQNWAKRHGIWIFAHIFYKTFST
jgi:hypothetical protein